MHLELIHPRYERAQISKDQCGRTPSISSEGKLGVPTVLAKKPSREFVQSSMFRKKRASRSITCGIGVDKWSGLWTTQMSMVDSARSGTRTGMRATSISTDTRKMFKRNVNQSLREWGELVLIQTCQMDFTISNRNQNAPVRLSLGLTSRPMQ